MQENQLLSKRLGVYVAVLAALLLGLCCICLMAAAGTIWMPVIFGLFAAIIGLGILGYLHLWRPYRQASHALAILAATPTAVGALPIRWYYDAPTRLLAQKLMRVLQESTSFELSKRQAQYLALQNQINPHFLYNTLESIRSEAMVSGLDSVAEMCEALAAFFRYTISNTENLVTVEAEIQNIRTYFYIQQYRFGSRLQLDIRYEEEDWGEMLKCRIPKLTLQPVVENAIIHGIEQKIGTGTVTLRLLFTQSRLLIRVSDDGVGIAPDVLEHINKRLTNTQGETGGKGGIAIANVNTRIKLLFGDAYGVTVYSTAGIGTDVEINLPRSI